MLYHVICYGASLTAGTSPPHLREYPYAPHLEAKLRQELSASSEASPPQVKVTHLGLPGWTSREMFEGRKAGSTGLEWFLKKCTHKEKEEETSDEKAAAKDDVVVLVVILAGTNDLGRAVGKLHNSRLGPSQVEKMREATVNEVVTGLVRLHECVEQFPTVVLAIPPSAWQASSPFGASTAQSINQKLQEWCNDDNIPGRHYFVPYPIPTYQETNDSKSFWSPDGLHHSPAGYQFVGSELAKPLLEILHKEHARVHVGYSPATSPLS